MRTFNIKRFKKGWFIGNFKNAIYETEEIEIAHQSFKKGHVGDKHTHHISIELTYIVMGKMEVSGKILKAGDFFEYSPYEISNTKFLEDTEIIVIKVPSLPDDKFPVDE